MSISDQSNLNVVRLNSKAEIGTSEHKKAMREVGKQFEAMFIKQSMEIAQKSSDRLKKKEDSHAEQSIRSMFTDEMAVAMADKGIGLADKIVSEIESIQKNILTPEQLKARLEGDPKEGEKN